MTLAPERTEILRRSEFRLAEGGDGQTLEGYAAVFNAWTDIRDAQGVYREQIAPGAFKRSLGQRTPVLQFDHGTHPLFGSLPLGVPVVREDRNGLFVRARLSDNWLIQPVRDAIRDGAITGMSFRFRVISDTWADSPDGQTRTLNEVELLELGPVVFPAYEQTTLAMRSLVGALDDESRADLVRELEATNRGDESTSPVAGEPAEDDGPAEPPVVSHDNRTRIAESLKRFRQTPTQGDTDADQ